MNPGRQSAVATAAVLLLVPGLVAGPTDGPAEEDDHARAVLQRAAQANAELSYTGETLWVTWVDGAPSMSMFEVSSDRGALTVTAAERYTPRLTDDGSGMDDHVGGWTLPLPPVDPAAGSMAGLDDKYDVELDGAQDLLDRRCVRLEIVRRADDLLRERLWVDEETGLLLRRETFDVDGERARMAVYLALDLDPAELPRTTDRAGRSEERVADHDQTSTAVGARGIDALRQGGWTVPAELPGGYLPRGSFTASSAAGLSSDTAALQLVYGDGLYTVSLFQQPGSPDWTSLPPGAQHADGLDFVAYEWPGAVPQRLVWEARGSTWSLVGDAPRDEFAVIAAALPHHEPPDLVHRIGRGLRRLWTWVSQWG